MRLIDCGQHRRNLLTQVPEARGFEPFGRDIQQPELALIGAGINPALFSFALCAVQAGGRHAGLFERRYLILHQ